MVEIFWCTIIFLIVDICQGCNSNPIFKFKNMIKFFFIALGWLKSLQVFYVISFLFYKLVEKVTTNTKFSTYFNKFLNYFDGLTMIKIILFVMLYNADEIILYALRQDMISINTLINSSLVLFTSVKDIRVNEKDYVRYEIYMHPYIFYIVNLIFNSLPK